jgi:hypothetical protein
LLNQIDTKQSHTKLSFDEIKTNYLPTISLQAPIEKWLYLEMDASYGRFQFVRRTSTQNLSETVNRFYIPLILRVFPFSFISVGGGFYASYRVGGVDTFYTNTPESELTSAHDSGEHGMEGVIGLNLPTPWKGYTLGLDFKMSYSLTERIGEAKSWQNLLITLRKELFIK